MMKENEYLNAICEYLSLKMRQGKLMFWRNNNIPVFSKGQYRTMPKFSMNGTPDIIVIQNGDFIGLEVKRPKNKQQESQKEFERLCKANSGEYYVVTTIEDVKEVGL